MAFKIKLAARVDLGAKGRIIAATFAALRRSYCARNWTNTYKVGAWKSLDDVFLGKED